MSRIVHYFGGYDTAAAQTDRADSAAGAVLRAAVRPGLDPETQRSPSDFVLSFVYARSLRNLSSRQQAGFIHRTQDRFGCSSWILDGGGGGLFVARDLRSQVQVVDGEEVHRTPLLLRNDTDGIAGRAIVSVFRPRDPGIVALWPTAETSDGINDFMHREFQGALDAGLVGVPAPLPEMPRAAAEALSEEARWALKCLHAGRKELANISVVVDDEGIEKRTRNGFRQFVARGRKDIAYAMIYAYTAFLVWLALGSDGGTAETYGEGLVGD